MNYSEVVKKAQTATSTGSAKVPFAECKLWKNGDQINLWTYWQGYQIKDIDEKGVDILLVGQDWGNPDRKDNAAVCEVIKEIQNGNKGAVYYSTVSPTDICLAKMFKAFGDVDITDANPGMRLFFTNYSLGYRSGSGTGGMTKTIMRQDAELFDDLVESIKPKIIICLGKITFEVVAGKVAKDFSKVLKRGEPFRAVYHKNPSIPVYGVAHPGSRGLYNVGGDEKIMLAAWEKIAEEYYKMP